MTAVMVNRNVDDVTGCELEKKNAPKRFYCTVSAFSPDRQQSEFGLVSQTYKPERVTEEVLKSLTEVNLKLYFPK